MSATHNSFGRSAMKLRRTKTTAGAAAGAYVPLSFAPGETDQCDWSHEFALIGGVTTTLKVAHVRLHRSRMMFVRAHPREPGDGVRRERARLRGFPRRPLDSKSLPEKHSC
jgi:hypothetical protein